MKRFAVHAFLTIAFLASVPQNAPAVEEDDHIVCYKMKDTAKIPLGVDSHHHSPLPA